MTPKLQLSTTSLRLQCVAKYSRTREGHKHSRGANAANVGCHKVSAAKEEFHIDMHYGHGQVAYFEKEHAKLLRKGLRSARMAWDDHSKIEADKKRGFTSKATVGLRSRKQSAPYSDMGKTVALGGAKVVVNSILVVGPADCDPDSSTTSKSTRADDLLVHKQAFAVCRLENDRRSTPMQQFNDIRFVASQTGWFDQLLREPWAFWLSDGGWDHSPRNNEVQWAHTLHHLDCDRDYDAAFIRPKGGSSYNEAEHVNCQETIAITKSGSATATHLSKPTSVEELWSNRLAFLTAIANAISGAYYACQRLIVMRSFDGATSSSDHTSASQREKLRRVMDAAPSKRVGLPSVELYSNIEFYREQHMIRRHLSFQLRRHECLHTMGRLCCRSDYPFPADLPFKPCAERALHCEEVPLVPDVMHDPERPGHLLSYTALKAKVARGEVDPRAEHHLPSLELKAWAKENGLSPSSGQIETLAERLLGTKEKVEDVERWFSEKRMSRFLRVEEERQALADPDSDRYMLHVTLRLMSLVAPKVVGMASPFGIEDYKLLLNDTRITLSDRGTKQVLQLRTFDNRAHIASMLQLDLASVERVPSAAERATGDDDDPLECAICGSADASDENPMLKCDGDHELEVCAHASSPPPLTTCTEPVTEAIVPSFCRWAST